MLEKYCTAKQATDDNKAHAQRMLNTRGYRHKIIAFPHATALQECASLLDYTYIACLVTVSYIIQPVCSYIR